MPLDAVAVPARDELRSVIWPLVPALPAVALPGSAAVLAGAQERLASRRHFGLRARYALAAAAAYAAALAVAASRFPAFVVMRNGALAFGATLLCTCIFADAVAWTVPTVVPLAMWLIAVRRDGAPQAWAVLLQDRSSAVALYATVVATVVAGVAMFLVVGPRVGGRRWAVGGG